MLIQINKPFVLRVQKHEQCPGCRLTPLGPKLGISWLKMWNFASWDFFWSKRSEATLGMGFTYTELPALYGSLSCKLYIKHRLILVLPSLDRALGLA